jgi:hypothetical protein
MRINLVTPFAEKDAVKALGARWDAAKKLWYITDVADLAPFSRWIPDLAAATQGSAQGSARTPANSPKALVLPPKRPITKPVVDVPHCGCQVLPWEDCTHTLQTNLKSS